MRFELKNVIRTLKRLCLIVALVWSVRAFADTIPTGFQRPLDWRVGMEIIPSYVPGTSVWLKGDNPLSRHITMNLSGAVRASFSFDPKTVQGLLFPGLYQGIGLGTSSFNDSGLLGNPVSVYAFQGAPFVRFGSKFWLGYEWKFGVAFGWNHDEDVDVVNGVISTAMTAHMGIGVKVHYEVSDRVDLTLGLDATHFSNGHTSWPNGGVNTLGVSVGVAYALNLPGPREKVPEDLLHEADRGRWVYDFVAYGAWRKRVVVVGDPAEARLCPGKFGVLGLQFSPLRKLNRYVAVGPALDIQWDESGGLAPYWVEGSDGETIRFERPPFGKQLGIGISAHAELTMPIFSVNVGLGHSFLNPKGDKSFYQSLTLKTFITKQLYLNIGYRLGSFKDPQNLMLGVGFRL